MLFRFTKVFGHINIFKTDSAEVTISQNLLVKKILNYFSSHKKEVWKILWSMNYQED